MKALRRVLFWCHLAAGALAGVVILVLCVTGVLLAFQPQVLAFRRARGARRRLPPRPRRGFPAARSSCLASRSVSRRGAHGRDRSGVVLRIGLGRVRARANALSGPATGAVLGEPRGAARAFFAAVQDLHRWLRVPEKSRPAGKAVTGAANLALLRPRADRALHLVAAHPGHPAGFERRPLPARSDPARLATSTGTTSSASGRRFRCSS